MNKILYICPGKPGYIFCYANTRFFLVVVSIGYARCVGFNAGAGCGTGVRGRNTIYHRVDWDNCRGVGGTFNAGIGIPFAKGGRKCARCRNTRGVDWWNICRNRRNVACSVCVHVEYDNRNYNELCRGGGNNFLFQFFEIETKHAKILAGIYRNAIGVLFSHVRRVFNRRRRKSIFGNNDLKLWVVVQHGGKGCGCNTFAIYKRISNEFMQFHFRADFFYL